LKNCLALFVTGKTSQVDLTFIETLRHQINLIKQFMNSLQRLCQAYCTTANYFFFFAGKVAPVDLLLNEILRHQIELTKHFINSQQRMYQAYCTSVENISADYKPVTLEDTKQVSCNLHIYNINRKGNSSNYVAITCVGHGSYTLDSTLKDINS